MNVRGYWCYKISDGNMNDKDRVTEVGADPHGMYCPVCKAGAVDTIPTSLSCVLFAT